MTHLLASTALTLVGDLATVVRLANITGYDPKPGSIPGAGTAMDITNWIAFLGFIGGLAGLVLGALVLAVGRVSGGGSMGILGMASVFWAGVAVLLIAGAAKIINAFIAAGGGIH